MKYKFFVFPVLVIFCLILASCSLAEDITPPPGYQYSPPPAETATQAVSIVNTAAPTASTIAPTDAAQVLPITGTEPAPSVPSLDVSGKVVHASGTTPSGPLVAHLYLFNSNSSTVDQTLTAEVNSSGNYQFNDVPASTNYTYFTMVEFQGVTYSSEPAAYDGKGTSLQMPVKIYDATDDMSLLTFVQVHMQFDFSTENQLKAQILYVVSNTGDKSVIIQSDGTTIPFIKTPEGAGTAQFELAQGGAALTTATNGFALLPGSDKQYGIIASFSLPYSKSLKMTQPFILPVNSETVIVPTGVRVSSDQLSDAGVQTFQSTSYHLYQGGNLASGSSLTFTIAGKPGDTPANKMDTRSITLMVVGILGLLLIIVGIFLVLKDRRHAVPKLAGAAVEEENSYPGDDKESILDAIIALDEQYKEGEISREVYDKRRAELKARLRELL